ncbi:hypothetical protein QAD02_001136 [Eretmocerus hayati]|uniref:Uncharacterized protein n=1 Tax=Eretmocerus hayati TaxID=131215 RepID=A0ACC2NFK2_9HYME|nr:hypothetical protein QAD02_001136 [Eretmocerus hayati]
MINFIAHAVAYFTCRAENPCKSLRHCSLWAGDDGDLFTGDDWEQKVDAEENKIMHKFVVTFNWRTAFKLWISRRLAGNYTPTSEIPRGSEGNVTVIDLLRQVPWQQVKGKFFEAVGLYFSPRGASEGVTSAPTTTIAPTTQNSNSDARIDNIVNSLTQQVKRSIGQIDWGKAAALFQKHVKEGFLLPPKPGPTDTTGSSKPPSAQQPGNPTEDNGSPITMDKFVNKISLAEGFAKFLEEKKKLDREEEKRKEEEAKKEFEKQEQLRQAALERELAEKLRKAEEEKEKERQQQQLVEEREQREERERQEQLERELKAAEEQKEREQEEQRLEQERELKEEQERQEKLQNELRAAELRKEIKRMIRIEEEKRQERERIEERRRERKERARERKQARLARVKAIKERKRRQQNRAADRRRAQEEKRREQERQRRAIQQREEEEQQQRRQQERQRRKEREERERQKRSEAKKAQRREYLI